MITEKYISKLLFEHDCVIVPDMGGFIANYTPARIHPVHHTFYPPSRNLAFNANLRNNDGLLADAIRTEMGISFTEAVDLITGEVAIIKEKLSKGDQFFLPQIGKLFYDRENNLQFKPDTSINYNNDSFGLTIFTSPVIKREALREKISRKLMSQQAVRSARRLPAALKWAAVFLPIVSMGLWAAFNPDKITAFYNNSASFLPSYRVTTKVPVKPEAKPTEKTRIITSVPENTPAVTVEPSVAEDIIAVEPVKSDIYFVIGGAFGVKENAENFVIELRTKGYDSFITGQNRRGLYMVSIQGFNDKDLATQKMMELRAGEFPNAWLLNRE